MKRAPAWLRRDEPGGKGMKRWRKRSQVGDSEPAVLTPAHVQVLRDRQDARGVHLVKMFLLVCLVGAGADAALFGSIDAQEYKLILGITILGAVLFAFEIGRAHV